MPWWKRSSPEPLPPREAAAQAGDPTQRFFLAQEREAAGDLEGAIHWYRLAGDAGHVVGHRMADHLREQEATRLAQQQARATRTAQLEAAADGGDADALCALAFDQRHRDPVWRETMLRAASAGSAAAMLACGEESEAQQQLDEAERWFRRASDAGDRLGPVRLAQLATRRWRLEDARRWWSVSGEADDDPSALISVAHLHAQEGDHERAESTFRRAAHELQDRLDALATSGVDLDDDDADDGGLAFDRGQALAGLARSLAARGERDQAFAVLAPAPDADPALLGALQHERGDLEAAESSYHLALEHEYDDPEANEGLARLALRRGHLDEARYFADAAHVDPTSLGPDPSL